MALSYLGKSSAMASGTGAIYVAVPSDYQSGDLLVLLLQGYDAVPDTPSGWNDLGYAMNLGLSDYSRLRVCYKTAGSSDPSVSVADSGNSTRGLMLLFRDWGAINKINDGASTGSSFSISGGTTSVAGAMVVCAIGFWDADVDDTTNYDSWACSSLDSITEGHDRSTSAGSGGGIAFAYGIKSTAGSVGNITATCDKSANLSAVIVFEVTPSSGASVTAVPGESTADAASPIITAVRSASVTAVPGEATADVPAPTVMIATHASVTAIPAVATADAGTHAVTAIRNASITAVPAEATADAEGPAISTIRNASVTAVPAEAIADAGTHVISTDSTINVSVTAVPAEATADAGTHAVSVVRNASVAAVPAEATADAGTHTVLGVTNVSVAAVSADATADAGTHAVTAVKNATVEAVPCAAVADAPEPSVATARSAVVAATPCDAVADAEGPTVTAIIVAGIVIYAVVCEATADAAAPRFSTAIYGTPFRSTLAASRLGAAARTGTTAATNSGGKAAAESGRLEVTIG